MQREVELALIELEKKRSQAEGEVSDLQVEAHRDYLSRAITDGIPDYYVLLDASQPWLCYWILHALDLCEVKLDEETSRETVAFLKRCAHPDGGYGGGPGQNAHLATTFASVSALAVINTEEALQSIDRKAVYSFLQRMKQPCGGFRVTDNGEMDARGLYCALSVASLCNILDDSLRENCLEFARSLQSFDGGFGGEAGNESHGGYTYCALAALSILCDRNVDRLAGVVDVDAILRWAVMRQMSFEGGFQGRTNKLVDGCYSFWVGAVFFLLRKPEEPLYFNGPELQKYILNFCQAPNGGLRDKPGKSADYYHTCYGLSGLSLATQAMFENGEVNDNLRLLPRVDPVHNILTEKLEKVRTTFATREF